jgi:hypothetical protein
MKDQILMSPVNAACCVGIPLFRHHEQESIDSLGGTAGQPGYSIFLSNNQPLAYIIDVGGGAGVYSAEWVEKNLIFVGDL